MFVKQDYAKYENYIRIGHKEDGSDLQSFPTPSKLGRSLKDQDLDAYTDLKGYTHRNRIRHNVEQITLEYNVLSDNDEKYILERIDPVWFYVELTDKKTGGKSLHKMYAGDRTWDTSRVQYNANTQQWEEINVAFKFTLTEQ